MNCDIVIGAGSRHESIEEIFRGEFNAADLAL